MTKHNKQTGDTDQSLVDDCTDQYQGGDLIIKLINVQDRFTPIRNKSVDFKLLETIVTTTKFKGSNFSMKVTAYAAWIPHNWRDTVYLRIRKQLQSSIFMSMQEETTEDRQIDRPFVELPIRDPQMMNHHTNHDCRKHSFIKPSTKDEENLIRVGLLASTLVSANATTSPAIPSHMDKYTISDIRLNNRVCKAYTGRFIRYQATLKPTQHAVPWIESSNPLMEITSKEVHEKLSCWSGPQAYINGIHVAGFRATGLLDSSRTKFERAPHAQEQIWS